jgi:hypothetical protein
MTDYMLARRRTEALAAIGTLLTIKGAFAEWHLVAAAGLFVLASALTVLAALRWRQR